MSSISSNVPFPCPYVLPSLSTGIILSIEIFLSSSPSFLVILSPSASRTSHSSRKHSDTKMDGYLPTSMLCAASSCKGQHLISIYICFYASIEYRFMKIHLFTYTTVVSYVSVCIALLKGHTCYLNLYPFLLW